MANKRENWLNINVSPASKLIISHTKIQQRQQESWNLKSTVLFAEAYITQRV